MSTAICYTLTLYELLQLFHGRSVKPFTGNLTCPHNSVKTQKQKHTYCHTDCFNGCILWGWIRTFAPLIFFIYVCQILQQNKLRWYGHVLQKEDTDWVKKYMEYEVEGSIPRGRPKTTWREVVQKDCQARNLNREDATDHSSGKKLIKTGW